MTELTKAINILPINYGRTESLNLFPSRSVRFRHITIEEQNGVLSLLPTQVPGAPATVGKRGKRKIRTFTIPHIPHDDVVLPEEVQGIRAFGSENELKALANVVTDHLELMRNKHAITLEHLRMGALKGIILDADGSELLNLYNEFEITPKVVNFALGTATTDVKRKCLEVLRHVEDNLSGEYMTGIHALVSPEFFDALTSHAKVKEAYERWQEGAALRNDMRSGFTFCGITFEEYRGQATDPEGNVRRFIEKDTGHCFPLGTASTFTTYFAPADFNETVSAVGKMKQTRKGAKVGKHEFIGAFMAIMPRGNSGVFRREGRTALPIQEVKLALEPEASKIIKELVNYETEGIFEKYFERELNYIVKV
ncbi:major capsid protein [Wolbachia pipientis]|uniref:major capsid protein n=1 Tax=Wolbachia pipientis TaxID=955 RepID=UPI0025550948|nr:major capsid protein [Wolbachia pipientis]